MLFLVGKRSVWQWLGGRERSEDSNDSTGGQSIPSRQATATHVTVGEALSLGRVYRAVQIHAIAAKQLSIGTVRNGIEIDDPALVRRPDPDTRRSSWIEQCIVSLATTGNAYCEIIREPGGQVVALPVLNPLDMRIRTNRDGRIEAYEYHGRELRPSQVAHSTLLRVPGTVYGLGPIQAAQRELRGAIDTRDFATGWMDEAGVPTGVLSSDQPLTKENAAEAKQSWKENASQRNGVVVLGKGLDYKPILLSPKDAQFIESQNFNALEIATMFGVPPTLMLVQPEGGSQTYQNVAQEWLAYARFTLMGYLVELEDALSELLPRGQRARFNLEALLRADTADRYRSYLDAIGAGFMTINEVRKLEGWEALATKEEITA